jgi:hypothetical protein
MNDKMITNIILGVDASRIQENKPSFFVSWIENGHSNYKFFELRFVAERFKNKLLKKEI